MRRQDSVRYEIRSDLAASEPPPFQTVERLRGTRFGVKLDIDFPLN